MSQSNDRRTPGNGVYAAFWRWHFYAGLLIMPVLMLMALTGGLYLFHGEIDDLVYRSLIKVQPAAAATTPQAWVRAAETAQGGHAVQLTMPATSDRSVRITVETAPGKQRDVFVDPHDAHVLGSIPAGGVMQTIRQLHSLALFGAIPRMLIELVAGWAIVMVATGVFLWWPRGQGGGVVTVRGAPRQRLFWRDLHAVIGLFTAGVILFLAVTGMPWSAVWGASVRRITNEAGWGAPKPPTGVGGAHAAHDGVAQASGVPWSMQGVDMSMEHMDGMAMSPPTLDQMVARADATGVQRPFVLTIPKETTKAWSVARTADRVEDTRTLYLDGATGATIADIGYRQYGPAAKAIQWGVAVHQGQEFGPINRYVMLAGCVAVWLLGISAAIMWWKRRPIGQLGAPPRPGSYRAYWGLAIILLPLGMIYPLVGASIVAALGVDMIVRRLAGGAQSEAPA